MARSSHRKQSSQLRRMLRTAGAAQAWRVRPLVLALMGALPWSGQAAPAANQVPVPVFKNGVWGVVNGNATVRYNDALKGLQKDLVIDQTSQRARYNWASFDIGADASVTFNMSQSGSQALNRVVGSTAPSQIFGKLTATNGGEIFLINSQGILFGRGAQVNVGGLFASTLDILDDDFDNGLSSLSKAAPTFSWRYAGGTKLTDAQALPLYNPDAYVLVQGGAQITTTSGGRVFLLAPKTTNEGRIETPQGQTVLAAGGEVFLNSPLYGSTVAEPMYASESNDQLPAVRGLLVEVADGANGVGGQVRNAGEIITAGGNTTLVGYAVNQAGRISASTSVSLNGSVFLLARSGATAVNAGGQIQKHATKGGELTLEGSSRIELLPDNEVGADGKPQTSADTAGFTASRIELSGHSIDLLSGSQIKAPGAQLRARAEAVPTYDSVTPGKATKLEDSADAARAASARVTVASGAVIDVSGTRTAVVDGARNFVTTGVLGKNDLADAPAQKDNPVIYYQPVSIDIRKDVPMMSTDGTYATAVPRTAEERMAVGGTVDLVSSGVVATSAGATIDVSGGAVNYTAVNNVKLSKVVDAAGKRYFLNDAPKDLAYTQLVTVLHSEAAYTEGVAAGKFTVTAGTPLLAAPVQAQTVVGQRQRQGLDAQAQRAYLSVTSGAALKLQASGSDLSDTDWARLQRADLAGDARDALTFSSLPGEVGLSSSLLSAGFGAINIVSDKGVSLAAQTDLSLAPETSVLLYSRGSRGIELSSSIRSAGGSVKLLAEAPGGLSNIVNSDDGNYHVGTPSGAATNGITLRDGVALDVSGQLVNLYRDGASVAKLGTQGGSVNIKSNSNLRLGAGVTLDVSGGAVVSADGKSVTGGDAGSITLANGGTGAFDLGATSLQAYSLTKGGTLSLVSSGVQIGGAADAQADLNLDSGFFSRGGFRSFNLNGRTSVVVAGNTQIAPRQTTWQLPVVKARNAASGTHLASIATPVVLEEGLRKGVDLTLSAPSLGGKVVWGQGALLDSDPQAAISLTAENLLQFDGRIRDAGGTVTLSLAEDTAHAWGTSAQQTTQAEGLLWLGQDSVIDVSGLAITLPRTDRLLRGKVLAGGSVELNAPAADGLSGFVLVSKGAHVNVQGAQGSFDTVVTTASGAKQIRRLTTTTDGGSVTITAPNGALLEGQLLAQGGGAQAAGGRLSLNVNGVVSNTPSKPTPDSYSIALGSDTGTESAGISAGDTAMINTIKAAHFGQADLSTSLIAQGGFADVSLFASDRIDVPRPPSATGTQKHTVTLAATRSVVISAPVYRVGNNTTLDLSAASVSFGNSSGGSSEVHRGVNGQDPRVASAGTGTINVNGSGQVLLQGVTTLQGVQDFTVNTNGDAVLSASNATPGTGTDKRPEGQLNTAGNVTIAAAQVYPVTDEIFAINTPADSGVVTFKANGATPAKPLSAGGTLKVTGRQIVQGGVVRAPLGTIEFNAGQITLLKGSETSVSANGLLVPFGSTVNGSTWTYNGLTSDSTTNDERTALLEKGVKLNASSGSVDVQDGATVDVSAGGDVVAYEFVPGPGGSTDVFAGAASGAFAIVPGLAANATGYAPVDRAIDNLKDASGNTVSGLQLGKQIHLDYDLIFGTGADQTVLKAGTYTVLPARYALLPGGFLVKSDTGTGRTGAVDLAAPVVPLADGSVSVAAAISYAGTSIADNTASRYVFASRDVARKSSEIKMTTGNTYFSALDTKAQRTVRPLPQDAGFVSINALQLALAANTLQFTRDGSRDGTLELSAENIHVGEALQPEANTLALSVNALNSSGAGTVVLGATRGEATDGQRVLNVKAKNILVDGSATPLKGSDIALVASNSIELKDGVQITTGAGKRAADTYVIKGYTDASGHAVSGDGASLRVSGDAAAKVVRQDTTGAQGSLKLGAVQLSSGTGGGSGSIVAEASRSNTVNDKAQLATQAITLGGNIAVGAVPSGSQQLSITNELARQINAAENITLRSYKAFDVYGASGTSAQQLALGGADVKQLTLDAAGLKVADAGSGGTQLNVQAGQLTLTNTTGSTLAAQGGAGVLNLVANGGNSQTGDVIVGPGQFATQGFGTTNLNAARSVVVAGSGGLNTGGDLNITAASVTGRAGAISTIQAGGNVNIQSNGATLRATAGLGATLSIIAEQRIAQGGQIELSSGVLKLQAKGGDSADASGNRIAAIEFGTGSSTSVAGQTLSLAGKRVDTSGGILQVQADAGSINSKVGSSLDVSASDSGADAGQLSLSATKGQVDLNGRLVGTAGADQQSGSISIDAKQATDLSQLAQALAAEGDRNFALSIAVRNREGSQELKAGDTLKAHNITLVSDSSLADAQKGKLDIRGKLIADGASGGTITLASRNDLTVHAGASLSAQALVAGAAPAQHAGGRVELSSSEGSVVLGDPADAATLARAAINVSPAEGASSTADVADHGGVVAIRAARVNDTDVKVAAINADITGARSVEVEAAKIYKVTNGVVNTTVADADTATLNNAAEGIKQRLTSDTGLASVLHVRSGVELQSDGDLKLSKAWNLGSSGEPVNLTLRAKGNVNIEANLSAGFNGTAATSLAQSGPASNIRLVAGADLASANTLATQGSTGDVVIGADGSSSTTFVRSTTGDISLAAARDIRLANSTSAVYTTGQPVASTPGYTALPTTSRTAPTALYASASMARGAAYKALTGAASPFYAQGGSVSLAAGNNVAGTAATDDLSVNPNAWWYLNYLPSASQTSWWTRYDQFKQGVAALGGGNVNVQAAQNVSDLQLAALGSGYQIGTAAATQFGGGSVVVSAGNDIVATNALASGEAVRYSAGGSITGAKDAPAGSALRAGPLIGLFNGQATIRATRAVQLAEVGNAARLAQMLYRVPSGEGPQVIAAAATRSLSKTAAADLASASGDVDVLASGLGVIYQELGTGSTTTTGSVVPDNIAASYKVAAPSGSIHIGNLDQYLPATGASTGISLLAGDSVSVEVIAQQGALPGGADDAANPSKQLGIDAVSDSKARSQVTLVGSTGDVTMGNSLSYLVSSTQIEAGRDAKVSFVVQQQSAQELTSVVAGRDVSLKALGIKVAGPGDLLVSAGRDVNLGTSAGIRAIGNGENSALPTGSAQVSVLAGVKLNAGDFTQAARGGYQVLGWHALSAAELSAIEASATQAYLQSVGKGSVSELTESQRAALQSAVRTQQNTAALSRADALGLGFADQLVGFIQRVLPGALTGASEQSARLTALQAFDQLPVTQQAVFLQQVLAADLRSAGRSAIGKSGAARDAAYAPGYASIEALFPGSNAQQRAAGDILMASSQIQTTQNSSINLLAPGGGVNAGLTSAVGVVKRADELGIVTVADGDINGIVRNDFLVNSSRVFTVGSGNILLWSSEKNIDAGRGAKTVVGTPPPRYYIDSSGKLQVDTSSSFSGSGIAVLNADSTLDLYAPRGEINAGDAGIKVSGKGFIDARLVIGASNISGPSISGVPSSAPVSFTPIAAPVDPNATSGGKTVADVASNEAGSKKRSIELDFLGMGDETATTSANPATPDKPDAAGDANEKKHKKDQH